MSIPKLLSPKADIRIFNDTDTIQKYRHLRWETFRKSSNLPLGSEYYKGEETGIYVGAFLKNKFIGGIFMIDRGNKNGQMHQIVVVEKYRRRGIGTSLIRKLENVAKDRGIKYMYAHARAFLQIFYEEKGYKLVKSKKEIPQGFSTQCQVGVPHVFMKKELT